MSRRLLALSRAARARSRQALVAAALLVLGATFVLGAATGYAVGALRDEPAEEVTVSVAPAPAGVDAVPVELPDVRGLALDDARQALADSGVTVDRIDVTEAPSALLSGTVTAQQPVAGTPAPQRVALSVAVSGVVPQVVGESSAAAVNALVAVGVQVVERRVFDPAVAEGLVTAVDPPVGAPLPRRVELSVSAAPSSVYLSELEPLSGGCRPFAAAVNGQDYEHALVCPVRTSADGTVVLLDRRARRIEGTAGVLDASSPEVSATLSILGDGRVLLEQPLSYGQAAPFSLDVTGVLRLEVVVTAPAGGGDVALGDVRVVGSPDDIAALDAA